MRILVINPNTTTAMTDQIVAAACRVAAPDVEVVGTTVEMGPAAIESYIDESFAAVEVVRAIACEPRFDGYVIACTNDPGLYAARELVSAPVVGIGEASLLQATLLAPTFAVLTTLARAEQQVWQQLRAYGLAQRCVWVGATGVGVLETASSEASVADAMVTAGRIAVEQHHAEAIALGCAGMADVVRALRDALDVPVIDGVGAAVSLVDGLVRCSHRTSKVRTFAPPVEVHYRGVPRPFGGDDER
jgi:allantoin racemase